MPSQREFERIEGQFHDGLGTLAEVLLMNEVLFRGAGRPRRPRLLRPANEKIETALAKLSSSDPRRRVLETERDHIEHASKRAAEYLLGLKPLASIAAVCHTARSAPGRAADLVLTWSDGSETPVSVKTDKSGKVALADVGQTGIERWAAVLYGVNEVTLRRLARDRVGMPLERARQDYEQMGHLMQHVVSWSLGVDAWVNDWSQARATDLGAVRALLRRATRHLHGADRATIVILSRQDGSVGYRTFLDELSVDAVTLDQVKFTPCRPQKLAYCTSLGIKVGAQTVLDHQVKHQRGGRQSRAFRDITTRAYYATA